MLGRFPQILNLVFAHKIVFYKVAMERKERQKELLEEYLQKRQAAKQIQQELLDEKIAKAEQERSRLAKGVGW